MDATRREYGCSTGNYLIVLPGSTFRIGGLWKAIVIEEIPVHNMYLLAKIFLLRDWMHL
jgi:hypothetical protein